MTSQCEKIYEKIASHDGMTGLMLAVECYAPKYTNRISEINQKYGHPIECKKSKGKHGYHEYFLRPGFPKRYADEL